MKAVVFHRFGGPEVLKLEDVPTPPPSDTEVQIEVHFAGVNPVDWKIREGLKAHMPYEFPIISGWDAAGVVKSVGRLVTGFKKGDEVIAYCRHPVLHYGTYAEYVNVDEKAVALKPTALNMAVAGALPIPALTAWQSLFDIGNVKPFDDVFIHAGAGGVGSFAIQFAKQKMATVVTTAQTCNHSYVKALGADHAIDYKQYDFVEEIKKLYPKGVDFIFDTVGGESFKQSLGLLKPNGTIVSLIEKMDEAKAKELNIQCHYVFVQPNGNELEAIANMIASGHVRAPEIEEFPLKKAAEAQEKLKKGHIRGKIVLNIKRQDEE